MELEASKRLTVDKYKREFDRAIQSFGTMYADQVGKWQEESKFIHKQRARDRSDLELLISGI
jgi:hypothetical protein